MKKILLWVSLWGMIGYAQEKEEKQPFLQTKNEIRVGTENTLFLAEYERQIDHYLSLSAVAKFGSDNDNFNNYEDLYLGARARLYFKDYITQSFLYLFFDDKFKIRYFVEGNAGYSRATRNITKRLIDTNSNYYLTREKDSFHDIAGTLGAGWKLLYDKKYSIDFSFGGGGYLTNNNKYDTYGYIRVGYGYRF